MTWDQIADEQLGAAEDLLRSKTPRTRAICSRSYYATHALLAARAPVAMKFPSGWRNPSHDQIPGIVDGLSGVPKVAIKQALARLRTLRTVADYGVGFLISKPQATRCVRDANFIFREVRDG